jgi:predicted ABC-type ATPase
MAPIVYVIAGPNGAGKTTFAEMFLPNYTTCTRFINADVIAQNLSPGDPDKAAVRAGRIMLEEIQEYGKRRVDFAFESTLSGLTHLINLRELCEKGYLVSIIYLWLPSVELALSRVAIRVAAGGHSVSPDVIRRRFDRSIAGFFRRYRTLANSWHLLDNSTTPPRSIALMEESKTRIINAELYDSLIRRYLGR